MSRAFVKEQDVDYLEMPERPVSEHPNDVTEAGLAQIEDAVAKAGEAYAIAQASVLELYDPDRSQTISYLGDIRPWSAFLGAVRESLAPQTAKNGAGLRFLTGATTSPTLADQFQTVLKKFPAAKWHRYEPAGRQAVLAGARMAFGQPVHTYYNIAKADVILALDSDFLCSGPASVRYASDFAARRRTKKGFAVA